MSADHPDHTPERAQANDEAMTWVVRLTSGESTSEEHDSFRLWRDASPLHAEALSRARRLWNHLEVVMPEIEQSRAVEPEERNQAGIHAHQRSRSTRRFSTQLTAAATLLLTIGLTYQYFHNWRFDQVTVTGETRTVTLADGSKVTLAAGTALSEDFTTGERRVRVARGQAFFRVAHNHRPFVVEAREATIRDVGTAFNVALTSGTTRIVVREGLVDASNGRQRVRLSAGQGTDVTATGIATAFPADAGRETAWMRGRFVATDRPLGDIIAAIEPYSSRRIIVLNHAVADHRMSAVVNLNSTEEWLVSLGQMRNIHVTTLPGLVIIT
jgi:transmembrane sensor